MALLRDFYQKLLENNWCDQVSQKKRPPKNYYVACSAESCK